MRFLTISTLAVIGLAVNTLPAYANNTDQAKLAVVKEFMKNATAQNLNRYASQALKQLYRKNKRLENQYQGIVCIDAAPMGTDHSTNVVRQTAKYTTLSNGHIAVDYRPYHGESMSRMIYSLVQENGRFKIDDYYQPDWNSTFKNDTATCLSEY